MTPESASFLYKAREFLAKARDMLEHWPDEAGRASYLAAFHAAQALIFERIGNVAKTRAGVRTQFGRLVKDDARCDKDLRSFLGRAYNFKAVADYETGPEAGIAPDLAAAAIEMAARFVDFVSNALVHGSGGDTSNK
jgi:uncharacterized protein (UPF0332 family)